jgi:hypothetical protein
VAYSNFTNSQINGRKSGRCKDVINISGIGGKTEEEKEMEIISLMKDQRSDLIKNLGQVQ